MMNYLTPEEFERNLDEELKENKGRRGSEGLVRKLFRSRLFWAAIPVLGLATVYTIKNWPQISKYISKLFQ